MSLGDFDYINDGATYQDTSWNADIPAEQVEDKQIADGIVAASYPILTNVQEWFEQQIAATDSRTAVVDYALTHELSKEATGEAFDIVRQLLEAKYREFSEVHFD